jgi:acetolactate synthase-1/3 small subunit
VTEGPQIARAMLLIMYRSCGALRDQVKRRVDSSHGRVIDTTDSTYTIELTGTSEELDAFIQATGSGNIIEVVRSGVSGIARDGKGLHA